MSLPAPIVRLLALAVAALLSLPAAPGAEAAPKKKATPAASQAKGTAKAKAPAKAKGADTGKASAKAKNTGKGKSAGTGKAKDTAKTKKATRSTSRTPARNAPRTPARAAAPAKVDKATQLNRLYDGYWDATLKLNPLQATLNGDSRWDSELPNFLSPAYRQQSHELTLEWLGKVQKLGPDGLQGQDLLSYQVFVHDAQMALEAEKFPSWMLPVNTYYSVANVMAVLGSGAGAQPFRSVQDYDAWAHRALGIPALFDQAIDNMRQGVAAGVVQPRALMEQVLPQLDSIIKSSAEESLFWGPVRNMPDTFAPEDRARITEDYKRLIENRIMPAYRALRGFIATQYLPACRASDGRGALPGGADWYAFDVRQATSTTLTPAQVHQMGLDEVARLQDQIAQVMKQVRFRGTTAKFFRSMQTERRFAFRDSAAMLAAYRDLQARAQATAPRLFATLPRAPLEIRPVEPFRAATAPAVSYLPPTQDGSRPGILWINTANPGERRTWEAQALFLHEGIPGHHYQLGLQQELEGLPRFRRFGGETAFIEGWGLYAESLGQQLGFYQDPYDYFGYLQGDLKRAARVVADTGLHAQGWSREQAEAYLRDTAMFDENDADAEVERMIAIPGQVLANKIGEMQIQQLSRQARARLGAAFDPREFHAVVLQGGSVPLDILQARVEGWMASKQPAGRVEVGAPTQGDK
nr:DUF885 family protein [Xanthomonas massiliensis]